MTDREAAVGGCAAPDGRTMRLVAEGAARTNDLVGRRAELDELGRVLTDAHGGRPRAVVVSGDAGIGKTTLLVASTEEALDRGFQVVWGHAWGEAGAPPFWPWIQVLRACRATDTGSDALAAVPGRGLVEALADASPRDATVPGPGDRFAVFDAVTQLLEGWTAKAPVMILLEDLHWADEGSWQLAVFVCRNVARGSRLAVVSSCRDTEVELHPDRVDLWQRLRREARSIVLHPLSKDEIATVFERVAGREVSDDQAARLAEITGGNALFVEEVARAAAHTPGAEDVDIEDLLDPGNVPSAGATVRRVVALLQPEGRRALEIAAAAGTAVPADLLADMTGLPGPGAVATALRPAVAAGVIRVAQGSVSFRHDLFRRAYYDGLPLERRAELHASIAKALGEGGDEADVFAIADHLLRAGTGEPEEAARWAYRAGTRALASFAPAAALRYFDAALASVDQLDAGLRCDVATGRLLALNALARVEGMDAALVAALDAADEIGDPVRAARAIAAMAGAYFHRGTRRGLERRLTRVLDGLGRQHPVLRAALLAELSSLPSWGPPNARRSAIREAVSLARGGDDASILGYALLLATWNEWDDREARLALASELVELGYERHRPDCVVAGCLRLAAYHLEEGDHIRFDDDIERVVRVADLSGLPHRQWSAKVVRACRSAIHGRYPVAERLADDALALLPDHPAALTAWYGERAIQAMLCGGLEEVIELADAGMDRSGDWADLQLPYCGLAAMHALAGQLELARSRLSRLLPGVSEWRRDPLWLPSVAFLAWTAAELRDADAAAVLYDLLTPYEDRMLHVNTGVPCGYWGSAAWVLGELAAVLGRPDASRQHFESALARQEALGDRPWLAHTKFRFARVLLADHDAENQRQAARLLSEARDAATQLRLTRLVVGIEAAERELEAAPAPSAEGALLFRREGDYWAIGPPDGPSRVKAMRGFDHIATLLDNPGRDVHVFEMIGSRNGPTRARADRYDGLQVAEFGGEPLLDEEAKAAYRRRIEALREDIDEAEGFGDAERAARAREELETLTDHLTASLGLGGRDRRMGSDAERARIAVTKAIRTALDRLAAVEPESAAWLRSRIRTGMVCRYDPPTADSPPLRLLR